MIEPESIQNADEPTLDNPSFRRLPPLLRRAWYSLNQAFRRRVAHLGITPDHFTVLRWLTEKSEDVTQRRLADLMASDPNTVTSVLSRMEANELIERRTHATDRRANVVKVLEKGRKVYDEARQIALELQTQVLSVLPEDRRDSFLYYLELLSDSARHAADQSVKPSS